MDKPRPSTSHPPKEKVNEKREVPQTPKLAASNSFWMARSASTPPTVLGKAISSPVLNKGMVFHF
jgi:hypothetical protein